MTDKEAKHFYNSKEWKKKRIDILIRDRNECQDCIVRIRKAVEEGIRLTPEDRKVRRATEVHHIQELKEHPELALDNIQLGDKKLADVLVDAIIKKMSQSVKWKKGAVGA